ncbi:hypothetical protein I2I05_00435 [Hymenobacter sp. BT683]|uniref:Uncharacterized protein n=1 Tax=Hymenobacter jeongseonensis TaxID=2791027 RepID=A0ABS0IBW2_9BACT|nr:hypothetical protein [Hymenobacter jeongseonensis]MBF9235851.1 hypothetical protein [Hymenobacter jeongseonensis]
MKSPTRNTLAAGFNSTFTGMVRRQAAALGPKLSTIENGSTTNMARRLVARQRHRM